MDNLFLIVGLGNPGASYARTRHNVGFMAVQAFGQRRRAAWNSDEQFNCKLARVEHDGRRVLICQPQTFMNASGTAVRAVLDYYKIPVVNLLVAVDDADLGLGEIRMRASGSSGGHHGLESIERHLATREYSRVRIGIGRRAPDVREITDHVLGKFTPADSEILAAVLDRVVNQMECWLSTGLASAMNQFNGAIKSPIAKES
jgi:peptidyl-tRNA hydrolase, PTH1 family